MSQDVAALLSSQRAPSRRIDRDRSLLLVVDIQQRLVPHVHDHERLIARTEVLLAAASRFKIPRLATEHCARDLGPLVARLREAFAPGEIFAKTRFGAADHPEFMALVRAAGRSQIIIAGMETHVCVMQTALDLASSEHSVYVVGDAVGSRGERQTDREYALERLRAAGCTLVGTETVLFEWARAGDDDAFRDVLKLVKALPD